MVVTVVVVGGFVAAAVDGVVVVVMTMADAVFVMEMVVVDVVDVVVAVAVAASPQLTVFCGQPGYFPCRHPLNCLCPLPLSGPQQRPAALPYCRSRNDQRVRHRIRSHVFVHENCGYLIGPFQYHCIVYRFVLPLI